eukprot:jgi/Chlat1/151/Chrsp1S03094
MAEQEKAQPPPAPVRQRVACCSKSSTQLSPTSPSLPATTTVPQPSAVELLRKQLNELCVRVGVQQSSKYSSTRTFGPEVQQLTDEQYDILVKVVPDGLVCARCELSTQGEPLNSPVYVRLSELRKHQTKRLIIGVEVPTLRPKQLGWLKVNLGGEGERFTQINRRTALVLMTGDEFVRFTENQSKSWCSPLSVHIVTGGVVKKEARLRWHAYMSMLLDFIHELSPTHPPLLQRACPELEDGESSPSNAPSLMAHSDAKPLQRTARPAGSMGALSSKSGGADEDSHDNMTLAQRRSILAQLKPIQKEPAQPSQPTQLMHIQVPNCADQPVREGRETGIPAGADSKESLKAHSVSPATSNAAGTSSGVKVRKEAVRVEAVACSGPVQVPGRASSAADLLTPAALDAPTQLHDHQHDQARVAVQEGRAETPSHTGKDNLAQSAASHPLQADCGKPVAVSDAPIQGEALRHALLAEVTRNWFQSDEEWLCRIQNFCSQHKKTKLLIEQRPAVSGQAQVAGLAGAAGVPQPMVTCPTFPQLPLQTATSTSTTEPLQLDEEEETRDIMAVSSPVEQLQQLPQGHADEASPMPTPTPLLRPPTSYANAVVLPTSPPHHSTPHHKEVKTEGSDKERFRTPVEQQQPSQRLHSNKTPLPTPRPLSLPRARLYEPSTSDSARFPSPVEHQRQPSHIRQGTKASPPILILAPVPQSFQIHEKSSDKVCVDQQRQPSRPLESNGALCSTPTPSPPQQQQQQLLRQDSGVQVDNERPTSAAPDAGLRGRFPSRGDAGRQGQQQPTPEETAQQQHCRVRTDQLGRSGSQGHQQQPPAVEETAQQQQHRVYSEQPGHVLKHNQPSLSATSQGASSLRPDHQSGWQARDGRPQRACSFDSAVQERLDDLRRRRNIHQEELDVDVLNFLSKVQPKLALRALDNFSTDLRREPIGNKSAWLTRILRQLLEGIETSHEPRIDAHYNRTRREPYDRQHDARDTKRRRYWTVEERVHAEEDGPPGF